MEAGAQLGLDPTVLSHGVPHFDGSMPHYRVVWVTAEDESGWYLTQRDDATGGLPARPPNRAGRALPIQLAR